MKESYRNGISHHHFIHVILKEYIYFYICKKIINNGKLILASNLRESRWFATQMSSFFVSHTVAEKITEIAVKAPGIAIGQEEV